MKLQDQPVQMSALAFLIEHGIFATIIILGFTVAWLIPLAGLPGMAAVGLFLAWRKK